MAKRKNLQPWLDYFQMLLNYEEKGLLNVDTKKNEAYVTLAALYTLAECKVVENPSRYQRMVNAMRILRLVRHLRTYAAWKSTVGKEYLSYLFSLNVVKDNDPHDPIYTIVLSRKRRRWKLRMKADMAEVVEYDQAK